MQSPPAARTCSKAEERYPGGSGTWPAQDSIDSTRKPAIGPASLTMPPSSAA